MTRRDALAGLSVANILLVRCWLQAGGHAYLGAGLPMTRARIGLFTLWLMLAACLAALSAWSRRGRWPLRIVAGVYATLLLVPADLLLRHATGLSLPIATDPIGLLLLTTGLILLSLETVERLVVRVLPIVLLPVILATLAYAASPLFARPAVANPYREPARVVQADGARVLWLLFDELDYAMLAGEREGAPSLPAFSALLAESFVATSAGSPSIKTLSVIPSIFTGRHVLTATPTGRDLALRFADGKGLWRDQPSPFKRVRAQGFWTGVVGWYHPYCDALPGQFDACEWVPFRTERHQTSSLYGAVLNRAQEAAGGFSPILRNAHDEALLTNAQLEQGRQEHLAAWRRISSRALALAAEQQPGLALVHYPVPHAPGILDLVSPEEPWDGYFGNAVLADRSFAELRAQLEAAGRWDDTILVVTADHLWRTIARRDSRVPLIVKFAGHQGPARYEPATSLLVLHDLLPRLVNREIATPQQLAAYLSASPRPH